MIVIWIELSQNSKILKYKLRYIEIYKILKYKEKKISNIEYRNEITES